VFRGKLLGALGQLLSQRALTLPPLMHEPHWRQLIRQLYRDHWNIEIRPPYSQGRGVALYLSRYVKGGPLPKDRPLDLRDGTVRFVYTDHRDGRAKTLCLSALEFIERVLWHAPPRGQHTVRRAGLYASAHREHHRLAMQLLAPLSRPQTIEPTEPAQPPDSCTHSPPTPRCPHCQRPLLRLPWPNSVHQFSENSITAHATTEWLGPTLRSSGHPAAAPPGAA